MSTTKEELIGHRTQIREGFRADLHDLVRQQGPYAYDTLNTLLQACLEQRWTEEVSAARRSFVNNVKIDALVNWREPELRDATVPTTVTAHDGDAFIRTGVVMHADQPGSKTFGCSIDICDPNGTPMLRLDISANDSGWLSVDAITTAQQTPTLLAFSSGGELARHELPAGVTAVINIDPVT